LTNIKILYDGDYLECFNLIDVNSGELNYFQSIGWGLNQFKNQFFKESNFAIGLYYNDILMGFILGDVILFENTIEYEVFLIYVAIEKRKLGYGTKLINSIPLDIQKKRLKKIYLEVAVNNKEAIKLYKKNNYKMMGKRKDYYKINSNKIDSYVFIKNINE
jgi:ribosomal-protein-alanine N-acetyltransferase